MRIIPLFVSRLIRERRRKILLRNCDRKEIAKELYACTMKQLPADAVGFERLHDNTRKMYENQADFIVDNLIPRMNTQLFVGNHWDHPAPVTP